MDSTSDDEQLEAVPILVETALSAGETSSEQLENNFESQQKVQQHGDPIVRSSPVPVLLITGFLGAGKTTLLNYILTADHGYRCAVVLNEYGDSAGIERAILNDSKNEDSFELEDWVQLSNGCACCSVKNDFLRALESLLTKNILYDYVLIETTGLASPGPIAAALWTDAELESAVCMDAIVTVVDCINIKRQLLAPRSKDSVNEVEEQIAFADVILCNKIDQVSEGDLKEVEDAIKSINSEAELHKTEHSKIDLGFILNRGVFDPEKAATTSISRGEIATGHQMSHSKISQASHTHDTAITTIRLALPGKVDMTKLTDWLDAILWDHDGGQDILRLKGLVFAAGEGCKVIQAVQEVYDVQNVSQDLEQTEEQMNRIVLIGRFLQTAQLQASFAACIIDFGVMS